MPDLAQHTTEPRSLPLTQALGRFVAELAFERLPEPALRTARMGFIDCTGTMIAGSPEPAVQILKKTLAIGGAGEAMLYFSSERGPAPEAAWINGTAAHALDYDDVALRGHPSTVLVPAILAEGEALHASGRDMLRAYAAGYEVWAELAERDRGQHHMKGWHPTGIFGAIGAAAACSALRRLDADRATLAIALAASQSSGLMANFGTMTKPYHAGRAAHGGVIAARLAEAGFTASPDALEHPQGFLNAVSPEGKVDRGGASAALGRDWRLASVGLSIKKFPACYCTHRSIDGMLDLVSQRSIDPSRIDRITVSMSDTHATILRNHSPQTGLAGKFSIEFAMAAAAIARRVGPGELTDAFVRQDDVQQLMRRVVVEPNQDYDPESPGASVYDQVRVRLADGTTLDGEPVRYARGHARRPLTDGDLFEKFRACLDAGGAKLEARPLFERLLRLQEIASVRELVGAR
jgi:2-methylcitrate dehydratase PrpD